MQQVYALLLLASLWITRATPGTTASAIIYVYAIMKFYLEIYAFMCMLYFRGIVECVVLVAFISYACLLSILLLQFVDAETSG